MRGYSGDFIVIEPLVDNMMIPVQAYLKTHMYSDTITATATVYSY